MIRPQTITLPVRVPCLLSQCEKFRNGLISIAEVLQISYLEELEVYLDWLVGHRDIALLNGSVRPWTTVNVTRTKLKDKLKDKLKKYNTKESEGELSVIESSKESTVWTTTEEISMVVGAISLAYMSMAALRTEELIQGDNASPEADHQWKTTTNLLKLLLSVVRYGQEVIGSNLWLEFLTHINNLNLQLGIIIKSGWVNRMNFGSLDDVDGGKLISKNNGTLTRIAIYCLGELNRALMAIDKSDQMIKINEQWSIEANSWYSYLVVMRKYIMGYIGLFYSIDNYQQDKIGEAIGLVNFGIVTLQGRKISDDIGSGKRAREWLKIHRQDSLLKNMQSTAELNYNKSDFAKMIHMTQDLTYLFDMLVRLRVKYTKENDTLKFDTVQDWKDIGQDSKWPQGIAVPVGAIEKYTPNSHRNQTPTTNQDALGQTPYY